eukprot:snap_masked-scaffold_66-processed-gene-0.55-mRNA-1 protein AED:0.40 eAED:0.43 QI:0/-1/0/1/-1/1/1/0/361
MNLFLLWDNMFISKRLHEGWGNVYIVEPRKKGKQSVALKSAGGYSSFLVKKLKKKFSKDQRNINTPTEQRLSIQNEISALLQFKEDPFIIHIIKSCTLHFATFFTMERCAGTLRDLTLVKHFFKDPRSSQHSGETKKSYKLPFAEIHAWPVEVIFYASSAILMALEHINKKSLVHADVKPDNILISFEGVPKLVDFGFCSTLQTLSSYKRQRDSFTGTCPFVAPELQHSKYELSYSLDVFSLGITQYYWLRGEGTNIFSSLFVPFSNGYKAYTLMNLKEERFYPFGNEVSKDICKKFEGTIMSMINIRPDKRPDAEEMLKKKTFAMWKDAWAFFLAEGTEGVMEEFNFARKEIMERIEMMS